MKGHQSGCLNGHKFIPNHVTILVTAIFWGSLAAGAVIHGFNRLGPAVKQGTGEKDVAPKALPADSSEPRELVPADEVRQVPESPKAKPDSAIAPRALADRMVVVTPDVAGQPATVPDIALAPPAPAPVDPGTRAGPPPDRPASDPHLSAGRDVPIIAGETAPEYRFNHPEEAMQFVVARCGGRYLIAYNGRFSDVGRSLQKPEFREAKDWPLRYSSRMVPVDMNQELASLIAQARKTYDLSEKDSVICFLSVPHDLDRQIFEAQQRYFAGLPLDVSATTLVDLGPWGCRVTGLADLPAEGNQTAKNPQNASISSGN